MEKRKKRAAVQKRNELDQAVVNALREMLGFDPLYAGDDQCRRVGRKEKTR